MKLNSLQDLYVSELKDLYDAENRIMKALPKMAEAASSPSLRAAFEQHLQQSAVMPNVWNRTFAA